MLEVIVTYSDKTQIEKLEALKAPSFHFIDSGTRKGKKEAWTLKSRWGAKLDPFAIIMKGDKPLKAFYSEAEDVVNNLITYLNVTREIE